MGSGALCLGCNLREDSSARQGGRGCRLSLPGQPAFMPRLANTAGAEVSKGSGTLCLGCILRKENPAPEARIACRLNPRRGMGAGSACPADQSAFMPRLANTAGAEDSMGSGTLCMGCNWRKDSSARQGGKGCRLSLRRGRAYGFNPPGGLNPLSSALAASAACGRTSPLLCAAIWRRRFL